MLYLGETGISKLYLGETPISKAYLGESLVWQASQPLPYDAEVEYLESTGTQNIVLPIEDEGDISIEIKFTRETDSPVGQNIVFAGVSSTGVLSNGIKATSYSGSFWISFDNSSASRIGYFPLKSVLSLSGTYHLDGSINYTFQGVSGQVTRRYYRTYRVMLFGPPNNFNLFGRIYSCSISVSGRLVYDVIPVRITNEQGVSEGAMYDRMSGQLFRNSGTGAFVIGPDVQ